VAQRGRGRALRAAWAGSGAEVLVYLDVDLSTDLAALLPLVAPLISGHSDLAIGTRLSRGARVVRGPKREFVSRCYNLLLRGTLAAGFSDAQCGFKAMRADVAAQLLPLVRDDAWFFDTELLVLAERAGLRIHEVPVDWIDDPDSRVDVLGTALGDLRGMARLGWALLTGAVPLGELRERAGRHPLVPAGLGGQLLRFGVVGMLSTLAYLLLYLLLRLGWAAQPANLMALVVTAVANTVLNRAFTFGVRGRTRMLRQHAQGLVLFVVGLALTSGALAVLHAASPAAGTGTELAVLFAVTLVVGVLRFLLLRAWVFVPRPSSPATGPVPAPAAIRIGR
ncbi:MAG: GtrA family protein, partial [Pseudonocardiaceae bacterium]